MTATSRPYLAISPHFPILIRLTICPRKGQRMKRSPSAVMPNGGRATIASVEVRPAVPQSGFGNPNRQSNQAYGRDPPEPLGREGLLRTISTNSKDEMDDSDRPPDPV